MLRNFVADRDLVKESFIRWLESGDTARRQQYQMYRNYYEGEHDTELTDRMREFLSLDGDAEFNLNFCPIPVDVLAERLNVIAFDVKAEMGEGDEQPEPEGPKQLGGKDGLLWEWWTRNRMDAQQKYTHRAAFRDGDAFIITEWDNDTDTPRISFELAHDGYSGVDVVYDDERPDTILYAVKHWRVEHGDGTGSKRRANVYYPDAIYKYASDSAEGGGWSKHEEKGEGWPLDWTDANGEPLGVPVTPFGNNRGGYDFGKSEIADVVPIQRALNKAVIDAIAAADVSAFQLVTLTGADASGVTVAPRQVLYVEDEAARWGHIPPADVGALMKFVSHWVMLIAQASRTPLSYFQVTGQVAAAETQKADDTALVSKAEDRAVEFGNSWENVMHMCIKLYNAFGPGGLNEDLLIETVWDSFERINVMESQRKQAEIVQMLGSVPGVDLAGVLRWLDVPEEMIEQIAGPGRTLRPQDMLEPPAQEPGDMLDAMIGELGGDEWGR